jgi:hypothetical protein
MSSFPPYRLLERDYVGEAEAKLDKLERLYHVGQTRAWDGKQVLAGLLAKHGGVRVPDDKREAIGHVFSVILWGELAAWSIASDIALMLDDIGPKMAATSQAHDEARHFYVMRDYLLALGGTVPRLDGYSAVVLNDLLDTPHLADKLLGMQLIVENVALTLFRQVAQAAVEPVLTELLPNFERDESRHVGLGIMYLPSLVRTLGPLDGLRLRALQLKIVTLMAWGTQLRKRHFVAIGIDPNHALHHGSRLLEQTFEGMRSPDGTAPPAAVLVGAELFRRLNRQAIDIFFPPPGSAVPAWQRSLIRFSDGLARAAEVALKAAAS